MEVQVYMGKSHALPAKIAKKDYSILIGKDTRKDMTRKVAIVGLGYAGLHTGVAFGKTKEIVGYDVDRTRIEELKSNFDRHGDFDPETLKSCKIQYTTRAQDLKEANFYVIIVPTPITQGNEPDFSYLVQASHLIGDILKPGDIVVYESTVYPGATEEICLPILQESSHLTCGQDFGLGYSPERINPGDKIHVFSNTVKVVSGNDDKTLEIIAQEYEAIVAAGIYKASNIRTAEAVKIVENIQRDANIALVNELARFFHMIDVDTNEVIECAGTKWNFMKYKPGLVGGHCIGVDPYYLIYQANSMGYSPQMISEARYINDHMSCYLADQAIKSLVKMKLVTDSTSIAILGLTFKENYDDIRNSKVIDLGNELESSGIKVIYHDPVAKPQDVAEEYSLNMTSWEELPKVSAIIIAVAHNQFKQLSVAQYQEKLLENGFIMDIKGILDIQKFNHSGITIWRL